MFERPPISRFPLRTRVARSLIELMQDIISSSTNPIQLNVIATTLPTHFNATAPLPTFGALLIHPNVIPNVIAPLPTKEEIINNENDANN